MANASPSGLGYAVAEGGRRPEPNLLESEFPVRLPNGEVVLRRVMTNGNTQDTLVFARDYPNAKTEAELEAAAPKRGAKSNG